MRLLRLPLAMLVAFVLGGCSSDPTGPQPIAIENETFASSLGINLAVMTKLPSGIYIQDLATGTGSVVPAGAKIVVYFAGYLVNGRSFDGNIGLAPLPFDLSGNLIEGWKQGIPGMRVGGIRRLVIPSQLGYGAGGRGEIPPHANLVFNIEVTRLN